MDEKAEIVNKLNAVIKEFKAAVQKMNETMARQRTLSDKEDRTREALKWWEYRDEMLKQWDIFKTLAKGYISVYPEGLVMVGLDKSRYEIKTETNIHFIPHNTADFVEAL